MAQEITIPAESFCQTLNVNVDNTKLSDSEFRQFVRNTLPIVIFKRKNIHVQMDGGDLDEP